MFGEMISDPECLPIENEQQLQIFIPTEQQILEYKYITNTSDFPSETNKSITITYQMFQLQTNQNYVKMLQQLNTSQNLNLTVQRQEEDYIISNIQLINLTEIDSVEEVKNKMWILYVSIAVLVVIIIILIVSCCVIKEKNKNNHKNQVRKQVSVTFDNEQQIYVEKLKNKSSANLLKRNNSSILPERQQSLKSLEQGEQIQQMSSTMMSYSRDF